MDFESSPNDSNYTYSGLCPPLPLHSFGTSVCVPHAPSSMDFDSYTLSAPHSVSRETMHAWPPIPSYISSPGEPSDRNPTNVTRDQQLVEVDESTWSSAIPAVGRTSSRQQRLKLKARFVRLKQTLPTSNQRSTRVNLLERATRHIRNLEADKDQLEARLTAAYHEIHRLRCARALRLAYAPNFASPST